MPKSEKIEETPEVCQCGNPVEYRDTEGILYCPQCASVAKRQGASIHWIAR